MKTDFLRTKRLNDSTAQLLPQAYHRLQSVTPSVLTKRATESELLVISASQLIFLFLGKRV